MNNEKNPGIDEQLKMENDFLKMKLMLEQGAQFGTVPVTTGELTPEMENQFLKNIMAFELEYAEHKRIKVFDKIGKPSRFKPVNEIPDERITNAWNELSDYLNKYQVGLDVCSPNVSARELYRFTVEELFDKEMDDMKIPGMRTCFIYDEFYPDHVFDNTRTATEDCIRAILSISPFAWMHEFKNENLRLNNHLPLTQQEFKQFINQFQQRYKSITIQQLTVQGCTIEDNLCQVNGSYISWGNSTSAVNEWYGNWRVEFELNETHGYWYISNVQITGIDF